MGTITAIKGQTVEIDLLEDSRDNGWTISGGKAIHNGCNQGYIELLNSNYTVGVPNVFRFVVSGYSSGGVNIQVGATNGTTRTANGTYTQTFTPALNDKVIFYSDGNLTVEVLSIYPVTEISNAITFGFDEKNNKWVSYYSYEPEMMVNALNSFFTNKAGEMWHHDQNATMNSFYGESYPSIITFYCNLSPTEVKNFHSMRQKSDKVWSITDLTIPPRYGKPNGQRSRLKKGNFKHLQGDWFGDFLRDLNDPRFATGLDALMNGAELQGNIMRVTIENNDETQVRMMSIDILVSSSDYTY